MLDFVFLRRSETVSPPKGETQDPNKLGEVKRACGPCVCMVVQPHNSSQVLPLAHYPLSK